jgi:hypothetical protein
MCVDRYKRIAMVAAQLNNLLQLAVALVVDLNLNRSPIWFDKSKIILATSCSRGLTYGPKTKSSSWLLLLEFGVSITFIYPFHIGLY